MHFHLEAKLRSESLCDIPFSDNFVLKSPKQLVQETYSLLEDIYFLFYLPIHFPSLKGGLGFSLLVAKVSGTMYMNVKPVPSWSLGRSGGRNIQGWLSGTTSFEKQSGSSGWEAATGDLI